MLALLTLVRSLRSPFTLFFACPLLLVLPLACFTPSQHLPPLAHCRFYNSVLTCHRFRSYNTVLARIRFTSYYLRSHARPAPSPSVATFAPSSFSFSILCSSIPLVRSLARMLALFALIRSPSSLLLICHLLPLVPPSASARPARSSSLAPLAPALHCASPSSS